MNTDVSTMTEVELKSLAYDNLLEKERVESNLKIINQELSRRADINKMTATETEAVKPKKK